MRKCNKLGIIIALVTFVATIAAAVAASVVYFEKKKKDEEDLEHYLDCSIQ